MKKKGEDGLFQAQPEQTKELNQTVTTNCNEIIFVNTSAVNTATLNTFPLPPGKSFTIAGWPGETMTNAIRVQQAVVGEVWFWRKRYSDQ